MPNSSPAPVEQQELAPRVHIPRGKDRSSSLSVQPTVARQGRRSIDSCHEPIVVNLERTVADQAVQVVAVLGKFDRVVGDFPLVAHTLRERHNDLGSIVRGGRFEMRRQNLEYTLQSDHLNSSSIWR